MVLICVAIHVLMSRKMAVVVQVTFIVSIRSFSLADCGNNDQLAAARRRESVDVNKRVLATTVPSHV
jgi:hypothetical protein